MQETKISLKLKHGEEIRRISLNERSFISLQKQIKEIFALNEGAFTLKYKDEEGDLVTIASDEELIESLQFTVNNLLKIEIISNPEEKGGRCGRKGIRSGIRSRKCDEKEQKDESPHQPFPNHPFHHRGPFKHAEHQIPIPPFPFHHGGFFQSGNVPSFNPFQPFHRNENEPSHCRGQFKHPEHPFHNSKGNLNPPHPFHRVPFHCGGFFKPENVPSFDPFQGENKEYARGEFPFFDNLKEIALNLFANPFNQNQDQNAEKDQGETEEESFLEELLNNALFDIESIQSNTPSSHQPNVSQPKEQSVEPPKIDIEQKIEENVQQELFETTKEPETEIPSNSNEKVEEKVVYPFEQKLQDLSTMGFDDRKKNILALVQNKGDVQLAIEYLLQN